MDEIQWNDQYDDPDAKIVLVSNDNVGFRVHAWTFAERSGFIKGLLDAPSQQPLDSAPIYLDYPSTTVLTFVRQIYIQTVYDMGMMVSLTSDVCKQLFELCDRFDAPQIYDIVSLLVRTRMQTPFPGTVKTHGITTLDVWDIFRLGALRDDFKIAKAAIAALDDADLTEGILFAKDANSFTRFDGLPMRYVYPLLMLRYTETNTLNIPPQEPKSEVVCIKRDSKAIAALYKVA